MQKHLILMQKHPRTDSKHAKNLCSDAKTCKICCFCILLHQKRVFLHTFASKTENHPIWCCCNLSNKKHVTLHYCTKTKCFCIVLHQKRQITLAFNKHLCSDGKTCKNYCFCILFYQKCVLLHDLYQNNQCFCIKTGCFCIILHFYKKKKKCDNQKHCAFA